jgi:hypothetical protein
VLDSGPELHVRVPKEFALAMRPDDLQKAVKHLGGERRRVKISFLEAAAASATRPPAAPDSQDDAARRALSHPEVQRFRELFPDAEVRGVRNLKE